MSGHGSVAREASRGFVLLSAAKFYFLVTATFSSLAFPRIFGNTVLFGRYRVVGGILNVLDMVVITATLQAASKLASEEGARVPALRRAAFVVQALLFGPVALVMVLGAQAAASSGFKDSALAVPLMVSAVVVLCYAFYAVNIGILNGSRRFGTQAGLDIGFATLKTGLMIGLAALTASVAWTYVGFSIASAVILLASFYALGDLGRVSPGETKNYLGRYVSYMAPIALYALSLNLLLQADVVGIKAALAHYGADTDVASRGAGIYGAAKNVATLPYQAVISLTLVVFPFVSRAQSQGKMVDAGTRVVQALRLASILAFCFVVGLSGAGEGLLALLFGRDYGAVADVLPLMLFGVAMMALMFVGNGMLASAGAPKASLVSGLVAASVNVGLLALLLSRPVGQMAAWRYAAWTVLGGCGAGAAVTLGWTVRRFGDWSAVLKPAACGILAAAVLLALPYTRSVFWPVRAVLAEALFLGLLVAFRQVRTAEVASLVRAIKAPNPRREGPGD